jgi:hypothetical protein
LGNQAPALSPIGKLWAGECTVYRPHGALCPLAFFFLRQTILNHFLYQPVNAQRLRISVAAEERVFQDFRKGRV